MSVSPPQRVAGARRPFGPPLFTPRFWLGVESRHRRRLAVDCDRGGSDENDGEQVHLLRKEVTESESNAKTTAGKPSFFIGVQLYSNPMPYSINCLWRVKFFQYHRPGSL